MTLQKKYIMPCHALSNTCQKSRCQTNLKSCKISANWWLSSQGTIFHHNSLFEIILYLKCFDCRHCQCLWDNRFTDSTATWTDAFFRQNLPYHVPHGSWYGWYGLVRAPSRTIKRVPYRRTISVILAVFHN